MVAFATLLPLLRGVTPLSILVEYQFVGYWDPDDCLDSSSSSTVASALGTVLTVFSALICSMPSSSSVSKAVVSASGSSSQTDSSGIGVTLGGAEGIVTRLSRILSRPVASVISLKFR